MNLKIYKSLIERNKLKKEDIREEKKSIGNDINIDLSKLNIYTIDKKTKLINDLYIYNNSIKNENIDIQRKIKEFEPNYDLKNLDYEVNLTNNYYVQLSDFRSEIPKIVNDIIDDKVIQKEQKQITNKENKTISEKTITWKSVFKIYNDKNILRDGKKQVINCNISLDGYYKFINFPCCEVVYLNDSTGSMSSYLAQTKIKCIDISKKLMEHYKIINFKFGAVFYKDPINCSGDIHSFFPLTSDIEKLENSFNQITASGGGDGPEDWVGGYDIILNRMKFTNSTSVIIHITDASAHGKIFCDYDYYDEESEKLINIIKRFKNENIKIIGFAINNEAKKCFDVFQEYYNKYKGPLISIYDFSYLNDLKIIEIFDVIIFDMISAVLIAQEQLSSQIKEIRKLLKEGKKEKSQKKEENPKKLLNEDNKNLYELIINLSY